MELIYKNGTAKTVVIAKNSLENTG